MISEKISRLINDLGNELAEDMRDLVADNMRDLVKEVIEEEVGDYIYLNMLPDDIGHIWTLRYNRHKTEGVSAREYYKDDKHSFKDDESMERAFHYDEVFDFSFSPSDKNITYRIMAPTLVEVISMWKAHKG